MSSGNGNHKLAELPKLLSTQDVAGLLGISPAAIRYRRKHGVTLPEGHQVGRDWVYCRRDVERWLHEQQQSRSSA
jgi:DNA-binding transcriptional MerR regulator